MPARPSVPNHEVFQYTSTRVRAGQTDPGGVSTRKKNAALYAFRSALKLTLERRKVINEGVEVIRAIITDLNHEPRNANELAIRALIVVKDRLLQALLKGQISLTDLRLCEEVTRRRV